MASEIKVDTIVNAGGDNDTGIDLATNDLVKLKTANSERMRVDASGNILFNKTALNNTDVGARFNVGGDASFVKSGGACLKLNRTSSHGGVIEILKDNTAVGQLDSNSGNLLIRTNGNKSGVRFDTESFTPFKNGSEADGTVDLGFASGKYGQLFAVSSSINTSDKTEKQDIEIFTDAEMKVAKKVSALFKKYRWKTAVAEKGDSARVHSGVIAQEVQSAFKEEGLDASKYGLWCSDTWWEKDDTYIDDDGKEQPTTHKWRKKEEAPSGATEVTRLGIRYAELISFICAYNEQRFASIEARLTALESK